MWVGVHTGGYSCECVEVCVFLCVCVLMCMCSCRWVLMCGHVFVWVGVHISVGSCECTCMWKPKPSLRHPSSGESAVFVSSFLRISYLYFICMSVLCVSVGEPSVCST